uniref:peptidylprolyl isomerase n=1 Tax=Taenia asiatica TaxID=60517 RepID=A0A0R3VUG1_TAEAS
LKRITRQGHSPFLPSSSDIATIHYVGWYHYGKNHGELFDSSRARNKPIRVSLCHAYPIKAFAVAIKTMKCGEICEIIVFPDYAYYDPHIRRYEIELISFSGILFQGNSSYIIK